MKYGATFKIDVYDYETEKGETLVTRASDYLQMQLWGAKNTKNLPEAASELYGNYAVLWFALKREGRLAEYGVDDDSLTVDTLNRFAERASLFVSTIKDDELPLRAQGK